MFVLTISIYSFIERGSLGIAQPMIFTMHNKIVTTKGTCFPTLSPLAMHFHFPVRH